MQEMREELEDLAFRELNPEAYRVVTERLDRACRAQRGPDRRDRAAAHPQARRVRHHRRGQGRRKRPYSIWRKMERKSVGFEQLSDIFGFRVIVEHHVRVLPGARHRPHHLADGAGRFKDYISTPKQNDYRSIHTTVIGPGKQRVELQIRTEEMHEIAEYGIAAHALYKDGAGSPTRAAVARSRTPMPGCAAPSSCWPKARTRRNSSSTPSSNCSTTRCSASPRRAS